MASSSDLVGLDDIQAAAKSIAGIAVRTPLLRLSADPAKAAEGELWLKPESLQPVGSFKLRGALHAVASLIDDRRSAGVVTHSSGNHGQGLAYAARAAGISCTVVAPDGTPRVKLERMRASGAEVVLVAPQQRLLVAQRIAADTGAALVPPFDSRDVIAGQGTVGLEIVEDCPEVDVVLVPVGGGGLASGVASAVKALRPQARIIGVEPELAADAAASFAAGHVVAWTEKETYRTIADGLRTPVLAELTFAHLHERLDDMVTVTEDAIREAMRVLAARCRLVVEPSGAVATAAWLSCRDQLPNGTTVAVVSGGNVDAEVYASVLSEPAG